MRTTHKRAFRPNTALFEAYSPGRRHPWAEQTCRGFSVAIQVCSTMKLTSGVLSFLPFVDDVVQVRGMSSVETEAELSRRARSDESQVKRELECWVR